VPSLFEGGGNSGTSFHRMRVAQKVWDNCNNWLGISSVRHNDVVSQFRNFYVTGLGRKGNQVWKGVFVAIVNEIWKHRNKIVFQEGRVDAVEIFTVAQSNIRLWAKFKWQRVYRSYSDWYFCTTICLADFQWLQLGILWLAFIGRSGNHIG